MKKIVTGIGEILWDLLPEGKQLGGAPCNFAFHASQAGCESFVVSAIGKDKPGNEIREVVKSMNLCDEYIQDTSNPTGTVTVKLDQEGHPEYTINEDVAWDFIGWEENLAGLAEMTDAVCFGSLAQRNSKSAATIRKFLNSVSSSCLKVFDINLRQHYYTKEIIDRSLQYADVLKLNEDELPVLASMYSLKGNTENQLRFLMETFELKYIAFTMGHLGSTLIGRDEFSTLSAPKVKVVDSVGAGDSFTAVLIAGLLNGVPLKEIHKKATEVAAYVCTCKGATPPINKDSIRFE
jgi:fructokinase